MVTVWLLLVPKTVLPLTVRDVADTAATVMGPATVTAALTVVGELMMTV